MKTDKRYKSGIDLLLCRLSKCKKLMEKTLQQIKLKSVLVAVIFHMNFRISFSPISTKKSLLGLRFGLRWLSTPFGGMDVSTLWTPQAENGSCLIYLFLVSLSNDSWSRCIVLRHLLSIYPYTFHIFSAIVNDL